MTLATTSCSSPSGDAKPVSQLLLSHPLGLLILATDGLLMMGGALRRFGPRSDFFGGHRTRALPKARQRVCTKVPPLPHLSNAAATTHDENGHTANQQTTRDEGTLAVAEPAQVSLAS